VIASDFENEPVTIRWSESMPAALANRPEWSNRA
jgi:hypothetical protein